MPAMMVLNTITMNHCNAGEEETVIVENEIEKVTTKMTISLSIFLIIRFVGFIRIF